MKTRWAAVSVVERDLGTSGVHGGLGDALAVRRVSDC